MKFGGMDNLIILFQKKLKSNGWLSKSVCRETCSERLFMLDAMLVPFTYISSLESSKNSYFPSLSV